MNTARALGMARMAAAAAILAKPRWAGRLFAGAAGTTPAVTIFARGFAARDLAIGTGMATSQAASPWIRAAILADAADAAAVLLVFGSLPKGNRALAFWASLLPAAAGALALREVLRHPAPRAPNPDRSSPAA